MTGFVSTNIVYLFPRIAAASFSLGIAALAAIASRSRKDARRFVLLLLLEAAQNVAFILEVDSSAPWAKLLWDAVHWPLMPAVCAGYVLFALAYVAPEPKRTSPIVLVLLYVPVIMAATAALAAWFGLEALLYRNVVRMGLPFSEFRYEPSVLAIGIVFYSYALFFAACAIVVQHSFSKESDRRRGYGYVLAALGVRLVTNVLEVFVHAPGYFVWSLPLGVVVSEALLAYSLFSERFSGPLSKARRAVMDTLLDPVFVLGEGDEVVDCNAAARTLLGEPGQNPVGESARTLFAGWPSAVTAALDFPEAETELDIPDRDGIPQRSYRITVASRPKQSRESGWKLLVFNDITGQKSDARDLAATNEELEFWVRQRTTALRQEVAQRTAAEERLREVNEEMAKTQRELLWTLSEVVESRSRETAYHVVRVGEYARILAEACGLSAEEVEIVTTAAPMHDVGKIAVPDAILGKPGRLTPEEREIMKRHTVVGKEILGSSQRPLLRAAAVIAFEHHERWDGKGYPLGKAGTDISLSGRIVSVCDVFDALYTKRVYKEAWPLEQVLDFFKSESGAAFEPRLVDILLDHIGDFLDITKRFSDIPEVPSI